MPTREELRGLVDRLPDDELPVAAENLRAFAFAQRVGAGTQSLGMGRSGHSDTSERADDILRETGFGE